MTNSGLLQTLEMWNLQVVIIIIIIIWKNWDFLVAQEQKFGARDQHALLEHGPDSCSFLFLFIKFAFNEKSHCFVG